MVKHSYSMLVRFLMIEVPLSPCLARVGWLLSRWHAGCAAKRREVRPRVDVPRLGGEPLLVWGVGFGVWGLGFGVWGLGCGVWGSGFGVWGLGFGVWGLGLVFGVRGLGFGFVDSYK